MRIEERVRPAESAPPPAEQRRQAAGDEAERARRRRIWWKWSDRGVLEDPAKGRAKHLVAGAAIRIVVHEAMDDADDRKARAGRVGDRGPATLRVPAEDPAGKLQAADGVRARGKPHAPRRHMEDIRSTARIEHVRPSEETRERLAVVAVADEAEACVRRDVVRGAAHMAAPAAKRESPGRSSHETSPRPYNAFGRVLR